MKSFKSVFVAILGAVSLVYLLNPTLGVFELIPDNFPVVGNLDEATATAVLLASLAHFGLDFRGLFGKRKESVNQAESIPESKSTA